MTIIAGGSAARMRSYLTVCAVVLTLTAYAAAPESMYIEERNNAIAKIGLLGESDATSRLQVIALANLEARLRSIIGPVYVSGFHQGPKINLATLAPIAGFGRLDGLIYTNIDDKNMPSTMIVTTRSLLFNWLREHSMRTSASATLASIVRSDNFYGLAIGNSGEFNSAVEVHVITPRNVSFASADFGGWSLAEDRFPLNQMTVTVVKGSVVYVVDATLPEIPALCLTVWDKARARAEEAEKTSSDDEGKIIEHQDAGAKLRKSGTKAWLTCVRRALKASPAYDQLENEAQDLVNRIARN